MSADHNKKNTTHRQIRDDDSLEEKFDLGLVLIYKQIPLFCISLKYKLETPQDEEKEAAYCVSTVERTRLGRT